jgi:hypothetical protein
MGLLPFSMAKTSADAEATAKAFARAGFKVDPPEPQSSIAFWKITINAQPKSWVQLYSTGRIQIFAKNPRDETNAVRLLQRHAITVDGKPFHQSDYKAFPPRKETLDDLGRLWLRTQFDNWNLERSIRILAGDLLRFLRNSRQSDYTRRIKSIPDLLDRARLRDPFAPVSDILKDVLDPLGTRTSWIPMKNIASPDGQFGYAIDRAASKMRQLLFDDKGVEKLELKNATDFATLIDRDVVQTLPPSLREKLIRKQRT